MINCAVMRYVLPIVLFGLLLAACGGSRLPDARGHAAGPQVAEQSPPAKDAPSNAVEEKDPPELPPDELDVELPPEEPDELPPEDPPPPPTGGGAKGLSNTAQLATGSGDPGLRW